MKMERAKIISDYLKQQKDNLQKLYKWEPKYESLFKECEFFNGEEKDKLQKSNSNFEREILLKKLISKQLNKLKEKEETFELIDELNDWIIKKWGGINTSINKVTNENFNDEYFDKLKFDRIASYSKIAAFYNPYKYVIYDSRVAYSLNWILLSSKQIKNDFFPIPEGRNSKMMAFDMNVLIHLSCKNNYKLTEREKDNKKFISNKDKNIFIDKEIAYNALNTLLTEVHKLTWGEDDEELYKTEMLLFSIADSVVFEDIVNKVELTIN
jgi:hypothetical protein